MEYPKKQLIIKTLDNHFFFRKLQYKNIMDNFENKEDYPKVWLQMCILIISQKKKNDDELDDTYNEIQYINNDVENHNEKIKDKSKYCK